MRHLALLVAAVGTAALESGYRAVNSTFGTHALRYKTWDADAVFPCRGGSRHHTGWADLEDRHLFFWYHEARHDPATAPLLIWHQGGPGGSSLHGMMYENGPCLSDGPDATRFNPHSWTERFNVVYLDQPAGVGFSYLDNITDTGNSAARPPPSQTPESALDSVAFIRMLYQTFPDLAAVDLHLSGESFAGRYVPELAGRILEYNGFFPPAHSARIPLRSILVGNPWIQPAIQMPSAHEVSCFPWRGSYPQHLDKGDCLRVEPSLPSCEAQLFACERGGHASALCAMAHDSCISGYFEVFQNATRSIYDRRLRHCPGPGNCYPDIADCQTYLNSQAIFEDELEASTQTGGAVTAWDMMDMPAYQRYLDSGDFFEPTTPVLSELLRHGLDVLIYVGVTDIICNPDGVLEALRGVDWEGKPEFRGTPWENLPWTESSGAVAGRVKAARNLWLAEVEGAGHMVPYDQPASALKLVGQWLDHLNGRKTSWSDQVYDDRGLEL
ncbi:Alpha/Beta hydrolase protein [Plectosphaerella plurivora]|uniref:Alpha/Beta hydrolase protein n=1 Tax=Plectosphaerella plurivora TaxID=936078 RepID=A0A9P8VEN1_9PEZI|nr:Alpha/Beta hydrolase protein [Plectosphaerella plurivora]